MYTPAHTYIHIYTYIYIYIWARPEKGELLFKLKRQQQRLQMIGGGWLVGEGEVVWWFGVVWLCLESCGAFLWFVCVLIVAVLIYFVLYLYGFGFLQWIL